MTETNAQLERMMVSASAHLERRDLIGYVCARNYRAIGDAIVDYLAMKNALLHEYGKTDGIGSMPYIEPSMPRYAEFIARYEPIANVEQDVAIMPLKYTDVVGQLTGEEMLEIDWMLED
jgi:hypothetical protein